MPLQIPNAANAAYPAQAEPDAGDIAALVAGFNGTYVTTGCAVTAQSTPNMTVAVAAGDVLIGYTGAPVSAGSVTISTADPSQPRFDLITASATGVLAATTGTPAAHPAFPAQPANTALLAAIYVPAQASAITSGMIVDKRILSIFQASVTLNVKNYGAFGDGVHDDTNAILLAFAALPGGVGTVYAPAGSYKVSNTIAMTALQRFLGDGVGATQITSTAATFPIIHAGNRQVDGVMRNDMCIEKMTISHAGGASTNPVIWIDGGGQGTHCMDVMVNQGQYGFQLTDLDRCEFWNCRASNQRNAGFRCEVGKENTWGTVGFFNCSTAVSDNNAIGWQFAANADQSSPNAFDRVSFFSSLFFMTTGVTAGTGLQIDSPGATSISLYGCLFEQNTYHVKLNKFTNISFYGCTFLDANNVCVDIFQFNTDNHQLAIYDCRLQQATNVFHTISGFPSVAAFGFNTNQGNITNLYTGSFNWRTGTDTQFMGGKNIDSANSANPWSHVWMLQLDLAESGVNNLSNASSLNPFQVGIIRCQETANVSGIILQAGQDNGEIIAIRNESGFSIAFDIPSTSHVANGINCVIAPNSIKWFSWSSATSLWYPTM